MQPPPLPTFLVYIIFRNYFLMYLYRKFDILLYSQPLLLKIALSFVQNCMTVVFTLRYLQFLRFWWPYWPPS